MRKSLLIAGLVVVAIAFFLALALDLFRVRWEANNDRFLTVVRANAVRGIPLTALVRAGVMGIGVRASAVANGDKPSPGAIRRAGLIPVLIVDRAGEAAIMNQGPFPYFWLEGTVGPDDQLVAQLVAARSVLIRREFNERTAEKVLWDRGFHQFVRGDEVTGPDVARLGIGGVVARCVRAVRERGIRVLVLSPFPAHPRDTELFQAVVTAVEREGLHPGPLAALPPVPPRAVGIVLHIGISALAFLLFIQLFPRLPVAGFLFGAGVAGIAAGLGDIPLRTLDAFLIVIIAPVYTAILIHPRGRLSGGIAYLLAFSGMTILFSLVLAAILAHPAFMLKIYQFRGVKAALVIPPFLATGFYMWKNGIGMGDLIGRSRGVIPIAGRVILLLIGGGLIWLIVMRSGNTVGLTTAAERRTRGFLETVLFARPRFKEFLLGHPLLLLFGTKSGTPALRVTALLFGLFGQTSILNSFSHAHTPLLISLLRTANGLVLGIVCGIALYGALLLLGILRRKVMQH